MGTLHVAGGREGGVAECKAQQLPAQKITLKHKQTGQRQRQKGSEARGKEECQGGSRVSRGVGREGREGGGTAWSAVSGSQSVPSYV